MQTIFKYEIGQGMTRVEMHEGAEVVAVHEQNGSIWIWAQVDTGKPLSERIFEVFGTGHEQSYNMGISREYLGTVFMIGGNLVLHVYEYTGI